MPKLKPKKQPPLVSPDFRCGDVIAFGGAGSTSRFIKLVTFSSVSHVGVVAEHEGELVLFESTTLTDLDCIIQKKKFKGTQAHPIHDRISSYDGQVWHYPLYRPIMDDERERLNGFLHDTIGVPYDKVGAFRTGGEGFSWVESWFHDTDLSAIFCSEWLAAAYAISGLFETDNVSRWNPGKLLRVLRRKNKLLKPRSIK